MEKILNVRIANRYDSYENWFSTENSTQVLKKGEIAFISVQAADGQTQSPPAVLCKVGDGTTKLKDLPYLQANSSDVYAWAKASTKPQYSANEITGLSDFISGEIQDTDTQYRITTTDNITYTLQSTEAPVTDESVWTNVSTFKATTVEAGTTAGTIKVNGTDMAITGWSDLSTQVEANKTAIETLNGSDTTEGSVAKAVKDASDALTTAMDNKIASAIASTYIPSGSINTLTTEMLVQANIGKVYNVTTDFTTTTDYVEGAGKSYPAGSNVAVVNTGTAKAPVYKFDVLMGFIDMSKYSTTEQMNSAIEDAVTNIPANALPMIPTSKITDFDKEVADAVNTELTKELGEGETSALQTTIATEAGKVADEKINALDVVGTAVANEFVTSVSQENGKVSVARSAITLNQIGDVSSGNSVILNCGGATV